MYIDRQRKLVNLPEVGSRGTGCSRASISCGPRRSDRRFVHGGYGSSHPRVLLEMKCNMQVPKTFKVSEWASNMRVVQSSWYDLLRYRCSQFSGSLTSS